MRHVKDRSALFFCFVFRGVKADCISPRKIRYGKYGSNSDGFTFEKPELSFDIGFRATVSREANSARMQKNLFDKLNVRKYFNCLTIMAYEGL